MRYWKRKTGLASIFIIEACRKGVSYISGVRNLKGDEKNEVS